MQVQANSEMDDSEWTWDDPAGDDSVEQNLVYSEPGAGIGGARRSLGSTRKKTKVIFQRKPKTTLAVRIQHDAGQEIYLV